MPYSADVVNGNMKNGKQEYWGKNHEHAGKETWWQGKALCGQLRKKCLILIYS